MLATSELPLGVDIPVIDPPVIETLLEAWVDIEPRPRFDLAVEADAKSDKSLEAVNLPLNWVWAFEDRVLIYWNSVLVTDPSAILVASIPEASCEFAIVPFKALVG